MKLLKTVCLKGFGEEEIESAQKTGKRAKVLSDDEDGKNEDESADVEGDEEQAHAEENNSFEDNEAPNADEEGQEEPLGDIEPEPEEPEYEQKKKKKRRGKNGDSELLIDDNLIINFITEMKNAAAVSLSQLM